MISLTKMMVMILPLLTAPVVARELGPSERGLYGACIASVTLIPVVVGLGLPLAVRRRASVTEYREQVRAVYLLLPVLVVPAFLLVLVVRLFLVSELSSSDAFALLISVCISTVAVLTLSLQSVLITQRRYLRIAILQSVQAIAITIGTVLGWIFGLLTISWLLWSAAIGALLAVAVGILFTRVSILGPRAKAGGLLREGATFSGSQISEVAANTVVQILAVSIIGSSEAGLFAIAMTIAGLPLALGHTIGVVSFQRVAAAPFEVASKLAAVAFRSAIIAGFIVSAILSIVSPVVIPLLFGKDFKGAVPIAVLLCLGSWLVVTNYVSSQLLAAHGRGLAMTGSQIFGLCLSVGMLLLLGPVLGGVGAAICVVVGRLATLVASILFLPGPKRSLIVRPSDVAGTYRLLRNGTIAA